MEPGEILLTFDDGPSEKTSQIIDLLDDNQIKGIFFVIGKNINSKYAILLSELIRRGHRIENHSFSHKLLTQLTANEILYEIDSVDKILTGFGIITTLVRPPYGAYNKTVKSVVESTRRKLFLWNIDAMDWKYRDWDRKVIASVGDKKNIILLHDSNRLDINKLHTIIKTLKTNHQFASLTDVHQFW